MHSAFLIDSFNPYILADDHRRQCVGYARLHCNCGQKLKREEESSLCSIGKITGYIPPAEDRFPVRVPQANKATVRGN